MLGFGSLVSASSRFSHFLHKHHVVFFGLLHVKLRSRRCRDVFARSTGLVDELDRQRREPRKRRFVSRSSMKGGGRSLGQWATVCQEMDSVSYWSTDAGMRCHATAALRLVFVVPGDERKTSFPPPPPGFSFSARDRTTLKFPTAESNDSLDDALSLSWSRRPRLARTWEHALQRAGRSAPFSSRARTQASGNRGCCKQRSGPDREPLWLARPRHYNPRRTI